MTAHTNINTAYSENSDVHLRPSRSVEYEAFAKVSKQLSLAWSIRKDDFPSLVAALDRNIKLWQILAVDVAHKENGLPSELRAKLFYLFEFVKIHTKSVLHNAADIDVLIEINTAIMRGLRGQDVKK